MKTLLSVLVFVICSSLCFGQATDYKVVFDLTSKDTNAHKTVMRQVKGIAKERPDAHLEVVIYSGAIDIARKSTSPYAADIEALTKSPNVSFKVCNGTMKRLNVTAAELIPGVQVVPDGIYEIISRQKEGWGYIKIAP
jgi:intracellular sulfur oxidation DsrE/DsrF family protein